MRRTPQIEQSFQRLKDTILKNNNSKLSPFAKENLLNLVREHRRKCDGAECNISLVYILWVAEAAGIEFTEEERKEFL